MRTRTPKPPSQLCTDPVVLGESANSITTYGYDPATLQLDIEFHKGGRYRYSGVTQERFEDFLRSTSKGKHFLAEIKGKYEFQKI